MSISVSDSDSDWGSPSCSFSVLISFSFFVFAVSISERVPISVSESELVNAAGAERRRVGPVSKGKEASTVARYPSIYTYYSRFFYSRTSWKNTLSLGPKVF